MAPGPTLFPEAETGSLASEIMHSREAHARGDMDFFAERLPKNEHYRIALRIPEHTLFLDIETTGLSIYYDDVTLVGGSIGRDYHCYLASIEKNKIKSLIEKAGCLVTFNGSLFDLKFLTNKLPGFKLPKAHVDLRFLAARFGHRGGQKAIEKEFNFQRSSKLENMRGELAPVLWHEYQLGNRESAKRLVTYNQFDVHGMRAIFDQLVQQIISLEDLPVSLGRVHKLSKKPRRLSWTQNRRESSPQKVYLPAKIGGGKPKITFRDLIRELGPVKTRFVGIDLTGSESRPSGWCFLNGNHAATRLLSSDDEILIQSLVVKPDIVSIDSPLSLPKGRISVGDDDTGREEFGIMRWCERELNV